MTLYLDTEFNGHGGELISLALVVVSAIGPTRKLSTQELDPSGSLTCVRHSS